MSQQLPILSVKASSAQFPADRLPELWASKNTKPWVSKNSSGNEWLLFDAGEPVEVERLELQHHQNNPNCQAKDCTLMGAPAESGPWTEALAFSTGTTMEWQIFPGASGNGQFWKLCFKNKHADARSNRGVKPSMAVRGVKLFGVSVPPVLLTINPSGPSAVICTDMAGTAVAEVEVDFNKPVSSLTTQISASVEGGFALLLPDGRILSDPEATLGNAIDGCEGWLRSQEAAEGMI